MLKFSDRLQIREGPRLSDSSKPQSTTGGRFPQGMQPIATAPESGWFYAVRGGGRNHLAIRHRDSIQYLKPRKDFRDGSVRYYMDGTIPDMVGWLPVKRG